MAEGEFRNTDRDLEQMMPIIREERRALGLDGIVGGLDHVVINTEPDNLRPAVEEFLRFTGYRLESAYRTKTKTVCVLRLENSADILVTSRHSGKNRFAEFNKAPKAAHLPNTRLEKFAFSVKDIDRYLEGQLERGVEFDGQVVDTAGWQAMHTHPSGYHGLSYGFVKWKPGARDYLGPEDEALDWDIPKPERPHLRGIGFLDHTATRVNAEQRDAAILEFAGLTNYDFRFAIYLPRQNSITSVARYADEGFAMVFTSGIAPYGSAGKPGPTEAYIRNYGTRVHHLAFEVGDPDDAYAKLGNDGLGFMTKLVGSREEGLKQAFSRQSPSTLLVNEYIHRYDGFDGFFTRSNVEDLTRATGKQ